MPADVSPEDLASIEESLRQDAAAKSGQPAVVETPAVPAAEATPASTPTATPVAPAAEPVATPAAQSAPAASTPAPAFDVVAEARRLGMQIADGETADAVTQRLVQSFSTTRERAAQAAAEAELARQRATYLEQRVNDARSFPQPVAQQQAQPAQRNPWEPPPFNQDLVPHYWQPIIGLDGKPVLDEAGQVREGWAPHTPPEFIQQAREFTAWQENWQDQLLRDPQKALAPMIQTEARRIAAEEREQYLRQTAVQTQQQTAARYCQEQMEANAAILFARDPFTNQIDRTQLTQAGDAMRRQIDALLSAGLTDQKMAWDIASQMIGLAPAQSRANPLPASPAAPQTHAAPQQKTAEQIKREFADATRNGLAGGSVNHNPGRGGTLETGLPQLIRREPDLGELLRAEFGDNFTV